MQHLILALGEIDPPEPDDGSRRPAFTLWRPLTIFEESSQFQPAKSVLIPLDEFKERLYASYFFLDSRFSSFR